MVFGAAAGYRALGEGRDQLSYRMFFESIRELGELDYFRFEPGFVLISAFFKLRLGVEVDFLIASLATIALLIKFSIFAKQNHPVLTILFYLCCWYPLHEYTQIRAAFAFAFILLAAEALFRGRWIKFGVMVSAAFLFHASSVVVAAALPAAYFLSSLRLPIVVGGVAVSAVILQFLMEPLLIFAEKLSAITVYYAANIDGITVNLYSGANFLTVALLVAIIFAGSLRSRRDRTLFILVLFGLSAAVAFQSIPVFSHRLREMFLIFLVPLAFNMRLTPRGFLQLVSATSLAGWYLSSHIAQGIIWTQA